MLSEEEKKRACNATLDDLAERIKKLPIYDMYVHSVKANMGESHTFLQVLVMTLSLSDRELKLMISSVSLDLVFAMIDQRLRNEILEEK